MPQEKIIIKFLPDGHEKLIKALNNLAKAQREVQNVVASQEKANKKLNASAIKMGVALKQQGKSFKDLGLSTKVVTRAFKGHTASLEKMRIAYKKVNQSNKKTNTGLLGLNHSTRNTAGAFSTLRSQLLLFNFAMAMGIRQIAQLVGEAAKIESMGRAFDSLSGGGENATIAMDKLQKATNGTMNQFDLFQQANNAMILGVSKNSDEMAEMFDIAQRLGRALGRDTKSSVESLITGIGRQSRLMLDNIGIIVKAEEAYQSYADELGVTVDALTDTDRKQAFLTATMESARQKVALLGDEILGLQDNLDKLDTATDDAGTALGTYISKAFNASAISGVLATAFEGFKEFFEFQSLMIDRAAEWNDEIENGIGQTEELASVIAQWNKEQESIGETLGDSIPNLLFVNELYAKSKEVQLELVEARLAVLESFIEMHGATNKEAVALQILLDLQKKLIGTTDEVKTKTQEWAEEAEPNMQLLNKGWDMISGTASMYFNSVQEGFRQEMEELKNSDSFRAKSKRGQEKAIDDLAKKQKGAKETAWKQQQALSAGEIIMNTASAIINSLTAKPAWAGVALAITAGVTGAAQLAIVNSQSMPKFATGGMIGGRRHSQGGTMIEAEQGEFIMSRSAVDSVGIENLNRMNEGGGGSAVTVNVSGNVLTEDFVSGELAENIKEAIRRGTDFGIS